MKTNFGAALLRGREIAWSAWAPAYPQTTIGPDFRLYAEQTNEREPTPLPRRLQPRLGKGFEEGASDGLREFDRSVPTWLLGSPSRRALAWGVVAALVIALIVVASLA